MSCSTDYLLIISHVTIETRTKYTVSMLSAVKSGICCELHCNPTHIDLEDKCQSECKRPIHQFRFSSQIPKASLANPYLREGANMRPDYFETILRIYSRQPTLWMSADYYRRSIQMIIALKLSLPKYDKNYIYSLNRLYSVVYVYSVWTIETKIWVCRLVYCSYGVQSNAFSKLRYRLLTEKLESFAAYKISWSSGQRRVETTIIFVISVSWDQSIAFRVIRRVPWALQTRLVY